MKSSLLLLTLLSIGLAPVCPVFAQVQQVWIARYDSPTNSSASTAALAVDSAGNIYVAGALNLSTNATADFLTVKYDANGNQLWSESYDGPSNAVDFVSALAIDSSANVYVTGIADQPIGAGGGAIATIKYDSDGRQAWLARYRSPDGSVERPAALAVDKEGNVYARNAAQE